MSRSLLDCCKPTKPMNPMFAHWECILVKQLTDFVFIFCRLAFSFCYWNSWNSFDVIFEMAQDGNKTTHTHRQKYPPPFCTNSKWKIMTHLRALLLQMPNHFRPSIRMRIIVVSSLHYGSLNYFASASFACIRLPLPCASQLLTCKRQEIATWKIQSFSPIMRYRIGSVWCPWNGCMCVCVCMFRPRRQQNEKLYKSHLCSESQPRRAFATRKTITIYRVSRSFYVVLKNNLTFLTETQSRCLFLSLSLFIVRIGIGIVLFR